MKKIQNNLIFFIVVIILSVLLGLSIRNLFQNLGNCPKQFGYIVCIKDYFNYLIFGLKGECYIKNYSQKGISNISVNLSIDVYFVNPEKLNFSYQDFNKTLAGVNDIWKEYGVQFNVRNITTHQYRKDYIAYPPCNNELVEFAENIVGNRLQDKIIDVVVVPNIKNKILFLDVKSNTEGFGLTSFDCKDITDINFVVIRTKDAKNITWNLAHEFSHILGNLDYDYFSGQYNLMTHSGCIKDRFYPTVLDQDQVNNVLVRVILPD